MSTGELYSYAIEHIPALWANREAFETALRESSGDSAVSRATELLNLPPNQTQVDFTPLITAGLPVKVVGGRITYGLVKEYENKRPLTEYAKTLEVTKAQFRNGVIRGLDFETQVRNFSRQHTTKATTQLAACIKGSYGASGFDGVYSKIDDASSKYIFDTSAHSLNGTTDGNWRTTNPIASGTTLANAYTYLGAAIAEWENLPDTDGTAGGSGNDFLENGMVLCASNIHNTLLKIQRQQSISSDGDNIYWGGSPDSPAFRLVRVSGMADDSLVITRDSRKGAIAGFYWCVSQGEQVDFSEPRPALGFNTYRWASTISWGVWPGCWIHSLLLKAA